MRSGEKTNSKEDQEKDPASEVEELVKCEKCTYSCQNKIALKKRQKTC